MRVEDAHGQPPSIPFWLGEAPARTHELSQSVSRLREEVAARVELSPVDAANGVDSESPRVNLESALEWLTRKLECLAVAAEQIVEYLAGARSSSA